MLTFIEIIIFILVLILTIYGFIKPLHIRYRLIRTGLPENRFDHPLKRIKDTFFSFFFLQCSVKKERIITGIVHFFILYGSLTFDTISINHIFEGFIENFRLFGHGTIGKIHSFAVDIFAIMILAATLYFIIRRYFIRPESYTYPSRDSAIIYTLLITVTVTFLLYEGSLIAVNPGHSLLSFFGKFLSDWLPASTTLVKVFWWIHILNVFVFIVYVPRSKYFHMIAGPINIAFKNYQPYGIVKPIDIENAETFGVTKFTDFTWKDLFDGFACVDCGRCDDYCPAVQTEKQLSPKNIMLHLKEGLLKEKNSLIKNKEKETTTLMNNIFFDNEIWSCTTCGSCMHVCPVKNEHIPKIIGLRQGQVLMEGKFPQELKNAFKGMQTNANPWGLGANNRLNWAQDLDVPLIQDNTEVEYLLYLGCAASFDDRAQKTSQTLVKFLKKQGISFGVLGESEQCCGETARRLGEEGLGQTLIQTNIELFKELNIKKILTPCPHCFNTFKNEYPKFKANYEVIHHSQLIQELINNKQLKLDTKLNSRVVIHDSCYLGRANNIYTPSRDVLNSIPDLSLVEHKKTKEHSFCCGAGGGLFWVEEKEPRINHLRVNQLLEVNPSLIATSCPYCLKMLDDGIKDLNKEENVAVKDLIEILYPTSENS